ncbi:MAG: hypothetical protein U1D30_01865 [Planctomycetota bacterium]
MTAAVPDHFEIDLDFNTMCNDSAHAVRVLKAMEKYPHVKNLRIPDSARDVAGNKYSDPIHRCRLPCTSETCL